jgi:hypothetical protein
VGYVCVCVYVSVCVCVYACVNVMPMLTRHHNRIHQSDQTLPHRARIFNACPPPEAAKLCADYGTVNNESNSTIHSLTDTALGTANLNPCQPRPCPPHSLNSVKLCLQTQTENRSQYLHRLTIIPALPLAHHPPTNTPQLVNFAQHTPE